MAETPEELRVFISHVKDFTLKGSLGSITVRKYSDENSDTIINRKQPLIIYFHGGGFVMGDLESHDLVCRHLCKQTNATIIAVDYKLAPEHKFPAAITDTIDAITEIISRADEFNIDQNKVILCGDSAGGALAAVGTIMSRDKLLSLIHI